MSRASERAAIAEAVDSILKALRAGWHYGEFHDVILGSVVACRELLLRPADFTDDQLAFLVREGERGELVLAGRFDRELVAARGLFSGIRHLAAEALQARGYGGATEGRS